MYLTQMKIAMLWRVVLGVLGGACLFMPQTLADQPAQAAGADEAPAKPPVEVHTQAGRAISAGLHYLARRQARDGHWELDGLNIDVAATAFGLLPFLLAGESHQDVGGDHPFVATIGRGLRYLTAVQGDTGDFGDGMYAHGLATWALVEAYRLTADAALKGPAQKAVDYLVKAQHAAGGWRYAPRTPGDTSVTAWQIHALTRARLAGLTVPDKTLKDASAYLDSVGNSDGSGYGYITPTPAPTMTAAGLMCRQELGWEPEHKGLVKGVAYLQKLPPSPNFRNIYYYHLATRVMERTGGEAWKAWEAKMRTLLLAQQEKNGTDAAGSWPLAGDPWSGQLGRVGCTSLCLLTLEVCAGPEILRPKLAPQALQAKELETLWGDLLKDPDLFQIRWIVARLAAAPQQSVPFLLGRLETAAPPDRQRIAQLVADLDSKRFEVRQRATEELEKLRDLAEPALRQELKGKPTLEVRQRVEALLARMDDSPPEALRPIRGVAVLERIGTLEAREVLEKLAGGAAEARLTQQAKAALERLAKKP